MKQNEYSSPATLRFGANALGQQEDMWLANAAQIPTIVGTSHIPRTSGERAIGDD